MRSIYRLCTPHSTLYTLHFALDTWHTTLYTSLSTLWTLQWTLYSLHFTPHSTHCTLHSTLYTLHFAGFVNVHFFRDTGLPSCHVDTSQSYAKIKLSSKVCQLDRKIGRTFCQEQSESSVLNDSGCARVWPKDGPLPPIVGNDFDQRSETYAASVNNLRNQAEIATVRTVHNYDHGAVDTIADRVVEKFHRSVILSF